MANCCQNLFMNTLKSIIATVKKSISIFMVDFGYGLMS